MYRFFFILILLKSLIIASEVKYLEEIKKSGKLAKLEQEAKDRMTNSALNLEPVKGLSVTQKPSVRFYEPSYTFQRTSMIRKAI